MYLKKLFIRVFQVISIVLIICSNAFAQAPAIAYQSPQIYGVNNPVSLTPTNTGGAVPAIPYGQVSSLPFSSFSVLTGVAIDLSGNIYIQDYGNHVIKKYTGGVYSIFAGAGSSGFVDGQGTAAKFSYLNGIVTDAAGNLYVSDIMNNAIRKITPGGLVTTLAGNGTSGSVDGTGSAARFYWPRGLAIDPAGNIYVADQENHMIRKVTPTGVVTTIAGNGSMGFTNNTGTSASFNTPTGVGIDASGNLYVADAGNNAIRKISPAGVVTTYATGFSFPREVRIDASGYAYVVNQNNHIVSRISPSGVVSTLAGTGMQGAADGNGNVASFNGPRFAAIDNGTLYVGDTDNNRVRKVAITGYIIDRPLPAGLNFNSATGVISGTPTALSPATDYTITAFNSSGNSSTVVNIQVSNVQPSIINFPAPLVGDIDAHNIVQTHATSNNTQTPITFTSSNPAVAFIRADGQIQAIAPGVTIITAYQNGNANYSAAVPVVRTFTIMQSQAINFPAITPKLTCDADFSANAVSSNPLLPLNYTSSNPSVATISPQGIIHIVSAGATTITASQNGNSLYIAAIPRSQTLTVNLPVVPLVIISPNTTSVCAGSSVSYTAAVSNISTNLAYQWQVNNVNAGTNSNVFTYIPLNSSDIVKCVVTNNSSCMATGTSNAISIAVNPMISPSIMISPPANAPYCIGVALTYTSAVSGGGSNLVYQWQVNDINAGTNSSTFTSTSLAHGDIITCVLSFSDLCSTTSFVTSNPSTISLYPVSPPVSVSITASGNNVYSGTPITFTATPVNAGTIATYKWHVNGINAGTNSPVFSSSTFKNGDEVTCILITNIPCNNQVVSSPQVLAILPQLEITAPNTFTPNGDGINDYWNIPSLVNYPNCLISIFNRYGQLVYESRGYHTPWDGNSNGETLPNSTFYYVISPSANHKKLSGSVTIIR